ncbi:hypothetical protein Droror1_Dr00001603 [Drosera rotundifolia]
MASSGFLLVLISLLVLRSCTGTDTGVPPVQPLVTSPLPLTNPSLQQPLTNPQPQQLSTNPMTQPSGTPTNPPLPFSNPLLQPSLNPLLQPFSNPLLQWFRNNPFLQPFPNPLMQPFRNPLMQPFTNPLMQTFRNPLLQPFSNPLMQPFRNPLMQPLTNPLMQPLHNPLMQPFLNPLTQPLSGNQIGVCWNIIMKSPACLTEIRSSLFSPMLGISANCCKVAADIGAKCRFNLSPLASFIAPMIRARCAHATTGGGGASMVPPPAASLGQLCVHDVSC